MRFLAVAGHAAGRFTYAVDRTRPTDVFVSTKSGVDPGPPSANGQTGLACRTKTG